MLMKKGAWPGPAATTELRAHNLKRMLMTEQEFLSHTSLICIGRTIDRSVVIKTVSDEAGI